MNETNSLICRAEETFYKTYNRYPVVFDHGDGVYLYDKDGKKYLDFYAGIGVNALGYGNEAFTEALKHQAEKLLHISNYFYNAPSIEAGEKLLKAAWMEKVFFTNSGTEAVEGALKIARRYGYNRHGSQDGEIIAMEHSFHGRTMGALSVTGNDRYQEPFKPLIPGIRFAKFNDLDSVKALVSEKTCGIILEPVQGEGGIYPASKEFLEGLRKLCDEKDILLIFDEIQCGMGRSGAMFAWQKYGVAPDVMTAAKALGNGVPIGAFLARGKAAKAMVPGDHGTTYGGNPFVTAAAAAVLDIYEENHLLEHVEAMGIYLYEKLEKLKENHKEIIAHRGVGLMQGLEFSVPVGNIIKKALLEQQVVLISAGSHVIRFLPPLVIQPCHIDEMTEKLERVLG